VAVVRDDRFVLRSYSPVRTIGGGQVLNPVAEKHKRFRPEVVEGLKGLLTHDSEDVIAYHVMAAGVRGVSFSALMIMTNLSEKPLDKYLQSMLSRKDVLQIDKEQRLFIHKTGFEDLQKNMTTYLQAYHEKNPLKGGMPKEELKSKLPATVGTKAFTMAMNQTIADKIISQEGDSVKLTTHKVSLGEDQAGMKKKISGIYLKNGLQPPYFKEVVNRLDYNASHAKDVLMILVAEGVLIKAKEDLYFHTEPMNVLKDKLITFLQAQGEITTPQFKEMTQASRKFVIPLLEYFDANHVTLRVGDSRKLRQQR